MLETTGKVLNPNDWLESHIDIYLPLVYEMITTECIFYVCQYLHAGSNRQACNQIDLLESHIDF